MLKKLMNKPSAESIFPQKTVKQSEANSNLENASHLSVTNITQLLENKEFIEELELSVTQKILDLLLQKYDFTPTDKYLEEVKSKKQYISQLDNYLKDRREINHTIENELQMFLQETTVNLSRALDNFTETIQNRIKKAENKHGIDSIKQTLLTTDNEELPK